MTSKYYIPPVGIRGTFHFHPPFDKPELDKKEYEVVEIRKIKNLVDNGENPFKSIYELMELTEEDYKKDIQEEVPIITLTQDDDTYLYVPASKIKKIPAVIGRPATERLITFGLGLLPDDIDLRVMYDNIVTMIEDTIGVRPEVLENPGGPTIIIPEEEYKKYLVKMQSKTKSMNKSWRLRYIEEVERNKALKQEKEAIEKIIINGSAGSAIPPGGSGGRSGGVIVPPFGIPIVKP